MPGLVTYAFSSISLKSILTRALIRSQGVVACRITLTAMFTRQALVYVYKRKEQDDGLYLKISLKILISLCFYQDIESRVIFA